MLATMAVVFGVVLLLGFLRAQCPGDYPMRLTNASDLQLKTGDILFTRASRWSSKLQQFIFGSFVNHCAMVYVTESGVPWVWDTSPSVGAYMCPLHRWIASNWRGRAPSPSSPPIGVRVPYITHAHKGRKEMQKSQIFVRRLLSPVSQDAVLSFLQKHLGIPYSYRFWKRAWEKAGGDLLTLPLPDQVVNDEGMYCSELIAETLVYAGELLCDARQVMPHDMWASSLPWRSGQGLAPAERIVGDLEAEAELAHENDGQHWHSMLEAPDLSLWKTGVMHSTRQRNLAHQLGGLLALHTSVVPIET